MPWLLNLTGWNGGAYSVWLSIKLRYTRASSMPSMASLRNSVRTYAKGDFTTLPKFGVQFPNCCQVPDSTLLRSCPCSRVFLDRLSLFSS